MKNVRKLTEGAILLAAFTVLLLLSIYVPLIGIILNFFLPIPFILFSAKNDLKSITVFMVASLIISIISSATMGLILTIIYGLIGSLMGYLIQKNISRSLILVTCSFLALISGFMLFVVSSYFFHFNLIDHLIKMVHDYFYMSAKALKDSGQQQKSQQMITLYKTRINLVKTVIPSICLMSSFLTVFFIQIIALPIIKRFGIKVNNWKPLKEISVPKSLVWYFLLTLIAQQLINPKEGTYLYSALINLTYILILFMIFQGITFIFFFFYHRVRNKAVPIIVTLFLFFNPTLIYILIILGIIDLGFDLRSRLNQKE